MSDITNCNQWELDQQKTRGIMGKYPQKYFDDCPAVYLHLVRVSQPCLIAGEYIKLSHHVSLSNVHGFFLSPGSSTRRIVWQYMLIISN